jgi:short-subunit dehydrogenase
VNLNLKNSAVMGLGAAAIGYGLGQVFLPPSEELNGKVALISGGSRGLGLALAERLLSLGCHVALAARSQEELGRAAAHLAKSPARKARGTVATYTFDLTNPESIKTMQASVMSRFDRIDILVNNAGIIEVGTVESVQISDFERAMQIMFWGHLHMTWSILPQMAQRQSGNIVNISSIGGRVSVPRLLPYCAAKFALTGFSEGLSVELRSKNIKVLTVIPGLMRTGSHRNATFKGNAAKEFEWFALGATLPGISQPVRRAAKRIVHAMRTGKDECITSLPAQILSLAHGLAPSSTRDILAFAHEFALPKPDPSKDGVSGKVAERDKGALFRAMTTLGRHAAAQFNEN